MRIAALASLVGSAAAGAAFLVACGSDRSPTQPSGSTSSATLTRLEITGPASIPPGESVQFRAIGTLSDGSTRDMTQEVTWTSSNRSVITIASGLAKGETRGEAVVSARRTTLGSGRTILVLPNGTYRVVGTVSEVGATANVVADARVELSGADEPSTVTDWNGRYRLYGVPSTAQIRITREGYQTFLQNVQITDHATQNFQLALAGARPDLSGTYTLRLTVSGACTGSSPMADDFRQRTYTAVLTQNAQEVVVRLSGGDFVVNRTGLGDTFRGRVDPAGATFQLNAGDLYYYPYYGPTFYPDVVERLSAQAYLSVSGSASGKFASWGLSGALNGTFVTYDGRFPKSPGRTSTCASGTHGFLLAR